MNTSIATFDARHTAQVDGYGAGDIRPRTPLQRLRSIANNASALIVLLALGGGAMTLANISHGPSAAIATKPVAAVEPVIPTDVPLQLETTPRSEPPSSEGSYNAPHDVVARRGSDIVIDVSGQPRLRAARQLALLTDARLMEGTALLARAPPVNLQWQGRDPLDAWRRLLGENIRHVVHCGNEGCRVWVLASNGSLASSSPGVTPEDAAPDTADLASAAMPEPAIEAQVAPMNTPTPPDE